MLVLVKDERVKYALIGCSKSAAGHLRSALDNGWDIVAISDAEYPKMRAVLDANGLIGCDPSAGGLIGCVYTFTDYRNMIFEKKPDVVSIAAEGPDSDEALAFCVGHGVRVVSFD